MIFFAYDLDDFIEHGRGFYMDYISYVPGPVAKTASEVIDINEKAYSLDLLRTFRRRKLPHTGRGSNLTDYRFDY